MTTSPGNSTDQGDNTVGNSDKPPKPIESQASTSTGVDQIQLNPSPPIDQTTHDQTSIVLQQDQTSLLQKEAALIDQTPIPSGEDMMDIDQDIINEKAYGENSQISVNNLEPQEPPFQAQETKEAIQKVEPESNLIQHQEKQTLASDSSSKSESISTKPASTVQSPIFTSTGYDNERPYLERTIYVWQEKNQYRKVEIFDNNRQSMGAMEKVGESMFVFKGKFDCFTNNLTLNMHVSKGFLNTFLTGNEIRNFNLVLSENEYSFVFNQNHTVALIDYCRTIGIEKKNSLRKLESLISYFTMSSKKLDLNNILTFLRNIPQEDHTTRFMASTLIGFSDSLYLPEDLKRVFNSIVSFPHSEVKKYKTILQCSNKVLANVVVKLPSMYALKLMASEYIEGIGYEFLKSFYNPIVINNEGMVSESLEILQQKKLDIMKSPYIADVARFLLGALPIRMSYLDFILELYPGASNIYDFKEKFKNAIGTESSMERLYSIRQSYPKLSSNIEIQMASLVLSEKIDIEDEIELLRIQTLVEESQLNMETKLKVLESVMRQLNDNRRALLFFNSIQDLKKIKENELKVALKNWLSARVNFGGISVECLVDYLHLCTEILGNNFQDTVHQVIFQKLEAKGTDDSLLTLCMGIIISPSSLSWKLAGDSLVELMKITTKKLANKLKVLSYLNVIDGHCDGKTYNKDYLLVILMKILDLIEIDAVFENASWFLLMKYFDVVQTKPEKKLTSVMSKIDSLKKNLAASTVERIEHLHEKDHEILVLYLGEDCVKRLNDMIEQIKSHKEHINDMRKILDAYCVHCSDFEKMKKKYKELYDGMMKMTFSEFQNQPLPGTESKNLKAIIFCKQSKSFSRLLKKRTSKNTSLVSDIIDLGSVITGELVDFSRALFNGQNMVSSKVIEILGSIKKDHVRAEVQFLANLVGAKIENAIDLSTKLETLLFTKKTMELAQQLISISQTKALDFDDTDMEINELNEFKEMGLESNWIETCKCVTQIIGTYSLDRIDSRFLDALAASPPLLQFIKETDQQSIMALVNAVEDLGENFIRQETVADLIEASKLIRPIISQQYRNVKEFCRHLSHVNVEVKLILKIESSNHSINGLRNLLDSIANRGELTKETIQNATQSGYFCISSNNSGYYSLSLLYKGNDKQTKQVNIADIQDLRSRALLIVNSRKDKSVESNFQNMENFIEYCDLAFEYLEKINNLKALGNNTDYCSNEIVFDTLPLQIELIKKETEKWQNVLDNYLEKHFFLNFFTPEQFWILESYFSGKGTLEDVYPLLNFINPITKNDIGMIKFEHQEVSLEMDGRLERLGKLLDKVFQKRVKSGANVSSYFRGAFAVLSVESKELLGTILKIFTNSLPKPSTLLFCEHSTTWQQLRSIVLRSFYNNLSGDLYCIAQIEKLPFSLQRQLVDQINRLREIDPEKKSSLCLIDSSGNQTSYVVNQLKRFLQNIPGTTTIRTIQPYSKAYLYSSIVSGVGKTETIRLEALHRRKKLVHLPIMDSVNRAELCNRLKSLNLSNIDCLHIDIRNLSQSNACLLNNLLFEIITFGMVIDDQLMFKIPIDNLVIFIELESQSRFWNFLTVRDTYLIIKKEIEFSLENLVFNKSLLSRSQVTFNYLKALDNGKIDSTDIIFTGPNANATVVSDKDCRLLINKYFFKMKKETNFSLMHVFINVLAEQFIKLSQSVFLNTEQVAHVTETLDIRSKLVGILLDVYSEFSIRSVHGNRKQQQGHVMGSKSEDIVLFKESGMIRWEKCNHLIVAFHKNDSTITALYRDLSNFKVTHPSIFETLQSQKVSLPDYSSLDQKALISELGKMAGSIMEKNIQYAMTADNLLKMMLILLRVEACVPVLISGETGCGKTSLVEFLAQVTNASFSLLNFHSGTTPEIIISFMEKVVEQANNDPNTKHLVFLDEINTCDYLGLVSEILTLKSIRGIKLPINISVIAACNPYRTKKHIYTSALEKDKASDLAYRVNPLPDCLIDYIWDYGYLSPSDEMSYIRTMLERLKIQLQKENICKIVCESQTFVRDLEDASSVSLRDVNRFIVLCQYFLDTLKKRPEPMKKVNQIMWIQEKQYDDKYDISSVVLALSICYYSRLAKLEYREKYVATVCKYLPITEEDFVRIVDEEQISYLRRMEIPPNIAWNRSLKENIFVILVCILNKLPVFVVGKPGCSKSLAIQLLTSNLRGEDSTDEYFKLLPQLIFIAFQGSESSTSEGILKVFEKARGYLKINEKEEKVIPVVILDEIGLAEISAHNPLKALHALLEPKKRDVAVVGISNWRLDAAKMNRAVHVSRPEADENELKEIAKTILYENNQIERTESIELLLDYLSKSYYEFISNKKYNNFHGLRDYYSLVKSVTIEEEDNFAISLCRAIDRNFGGLPTSAMNFKKILFEKASITEAIPSDLPVLELIKENIEDKNARHLMLITNSDSALDIITHCYKEFINRSPEIIYGSQFNLDKTEEYSYVVLNKIIYCMEEGYTLILKDLDSVYGSLYDMLNQNYTYVAKRRNCRIAIGPHSNPMCHVHENFRCIVLLDQKRLSSCDPPFLNRFEKQILNFENISHSKVNECVMRLNEWVENITNLESDVFTVNDMFPSYSSDTLTSLVLANTDSITSLDQCVETCKEALVATSTFDGMIRTLFSSLSKEDCERWLNRYQKDKHNNLFEYYNNCDGFAHMIMTFSHILTELNFDCLSVRVREFKTERDFTKQIEEFFSDQENSLLTIHFESHLDGKFVPMVKFIVDHQIQNSGRTDKKVFLILHISRDIYENANEDWKLNFMNGWKQVTIDDLSPSYDQTKLLDIDNMFSSEFYSIESICKDIIGTALMKIDYFAVNLEYITTLSTNMIEDEEFLEFISDILSKELQKIQFNWRRNVALNKKKLAESGCLIDAIRSEMQDIVQQKLLSVLKFIEQHSALESFFTCDPKLRFVWKDITAKHYSVNDVPAKASKIMLIKGLSLPYSKWQCKIYKDLQVKLEMLKQNDNQEQELENLLCSLIESSECIYGHLGDTDKLLKKDFLVLTAQELGLKPEFNQIFENIILDLFDITLSSSKERLILKVWNNQKSLLSIVELIKYCSENSIVITDDINCLNNLLETITHSLLQDGSQNPSIEWKDKISAVLQILLEEKLSVLLLKILKDFSHYLLDHTYEIQQICKEILNYNWDLENPNLISNILEILSKSKNTAQAKMVFISRLELTEELLEVVCKELIGINDVKYLTPIAYQVCDNHIEDLEDGNFDSLRVLNELLIQKPYCPLYYVLIDVLEELVSDQELSNEDELRSLGNKINSPNSESVPDVERAYSVALFRHHLKNIASQDDLQTSLSEITGYLNKDEDAKNYFLKCVRQSFDSWLEFKEFVESDISILLDVDLANKSFDSLGYNIFRSLPGYKQVEKAFDEMYYLKNEIEMSKLIQESKSNPKLLYNLMGLIANNIHFSQITSEKLSFCVESFTKSFALGFSRTVTKLVTFLLRAAAVNDSNYVIGISLVCLAVCIPENPISIFIKNPNIIRSTYVVTAEDDILGGILKAIKANDGGHSRYRCTCGYVYLIGNCGKPSATSRCPTCGATLGGEAHQLIQGSRIDGENRDGANSSNEKGYTIPNSTDDGSNTVRLFSPTMFKIWQFFINSIILNGLDIELVTMEEIRGICVQNQPNNPFEYFNKKTIQDWNLLSQALDQQGESLCFFLQQCINSNLDFLFGNNERLNTEDKRTFFENKLIENTNRVLGDISLSIRDIKMNSTKTEESSSIQSIIEETYTPTSLQLYKFTEFRITASPSVQGMKALFMSNPENARLYPFLDAYLVYEKELYSLESLFDLITFSNALMDRCDNTIDRSNAEKIEMKYYAENNGLAELYEKVVKGWKVEKSSNYGCKQLKTKRKIDKEMLSFFLLEDQQEPFGLYICAALQGYSEVQNNFIDFASQNAEKSSNLAFLKSTNGIIGLPTIPVQKAQKKDLIIIEPELLENIAMTFSYKNYEYGKGTSIGYLFDKIEFALASKYLLGKKRLDFENLRKIKYIGEAFGNNLDMAARRKIPNPIPLDDIERNKVKLLINDLPRLKKIQGSLQKLLEIMNLVNFNPDVTVSIFCLDWKINLNDKEQFFTNFTLNKVVNLYEYVEEVIFDFEVNFLSELYTTELEGEVVQRIIRSCQDKNFDINHLTTALKRFIIRFLIPAFFQKTNEGLNLYIGMECLWPVTSQNEIATIEDIIPDSVCLCHTRSLCSSLSNYLAEQDLKAKETDNFVMQEEFLRNPTQPSLIFKKPEDKKKKPAQVGRRLKINA